MGDKEQHVPRRGAHHQNRARSGYNRIYQHLGVRDLREIIDRKRSEKGHVNDDSIPPDPSYNYLNDPMRENAENAQNTSKQYNPRKFRNNTINNNLKKNNEHVKQKDIENPLNIKVEFSTSTGEHVYKIDENTVLPTIKHVPDHKPPYNRSFRGHGRGRGRGHKSYQSRTIRSNKQNLYNEPESSQAPPVSEAVEENWDDELNDPKVHEENEHLETGAAGYVDKGENAEAGGDQGDTVVKEHLEKQIENLNLDEKQYENSTNASQS